MKKRNDLDCNIHYKSKFLIKVYSAKFSKFEASVFRVQSSKGLTRRVLDLLLTDFDETWQVCNIKI